MDLTTQDSPGTHMRNEREQQITRDIQKIELKIQKQEHDKYLRIHTPQPVSPFPVNLAENPSPEPEIEHDWDYRLDLANGWLAIEGSQHTKEQSANKRVIQEVFNKCAQ